MCLEKASHPCCILNCYSHLVGQCWNELGIVLELLAELDLHAKRVLNYCNVSPKKVLHACFGIFAGALFFLPHHLGISRTASLFDNVTIVGIFSNTI